MSKANIVTLDVQQIFKKTSSCMWYSSKYCKFYLLQDFFVIGDGPVAMYRQELFSFTAGK